MSSPNTTPSPPNQAASRLASLSIAALLAWPSPAPADSAFDPLLDAEPPSNAQRPWRPPVSASGFQIGASLVGYGGRVRARLERDLSRLERGGGAGLEVALGGRTQGAVEVSVRAGAGLGSSVVPRTDAVALAYDAYLEPSVTAEVARGTRWALRAGGGGSLWAFDIDPTGASQLALGPAVSLSGARTLDPRSEVVVDLTAVAAWNVFAYDASQSPGEAAQFAPLLRLGLGYRLRGF